MFRRTRYQQGSLQRVKRKRGPDCWAFRWYELDGAGRRQYRKAVVGTVEQYRTESSAQTAVGALRLTINQEAPRSKWQPILIRDLITHYKETELGLDVPEGDLDEHEKAYSTKKTYRIFLDRWIKEPDGSDADHGFIFDEMTRKEFNVKYRKYKDEVGTAPLNTQLAAWLTDKSITVVRYYRKKKTPDTYVWYRKDENSPDIEKLASEIKEESGQEIYDALIEDIKEGRIEGGTRSVTNDQVEWFLIAGDKIIQGIPQFAQAMGEDGLVSLDGLADAYWYLHTQHRAAWTHELDVRTFKESF